MGYQVLARKYRPQRFADVAGKIRHTDPAQCAHQNRIAHGYIFSATEVSARRLSRALWPWR